jgi:hypothetical protein
MSRAKLRYLNLVAVGLLLWAVSASYAIAQAHASDSTTDAVTPVSSGITPDKSQSNGANTNATNADQNISFKMLTPHEDAGVIHALGQAVPISIQPGYIKLGPLFLTSIDFLQAYDRFDHEGVISEQMTSVVRTHVLYSKVFKHNTQIAFQYAPQLFFIGGQLFTDFTTQNVSLDTVIPVTKRLNLRFGDNFRYSGSNSQYLDNALSFSATTGAVVQNNFLQRPGNWVSNDFHLSMDYQLGVRNRITITPSVGYLYTNEPYGTNRGQRFGGEVAFTRSLSARTDVGISYSAHMAAFQTGYSDSLYQNVSLSYAHSFGRGWQFSSRLGAGNRSYSNNSNWTPIPAVSLVKQFRSSVIAVAYQRSSEFYGQLNNGYSDQVDVSYSRRLSRSLSLSVGAGKYGQVWTPQHDGARYVRVASSYHLLSNFYTTASYMYRMQSGSANDLLLGRRDLATIGISWIPGERGAQ